MHLNFALPFPHLYRYVRVREVRVKKDGLRRSHDNASPLFSPPLSTTHNYAESEKSLKRKTSLPYDHPPPLPGLPLMTNR